MCGNIGEYSSCYFLRTTKRFKPCKTKDELLAVMLVGMCGLLIVR